MSRAVAVVAVLLSWTCASSIQAQMPFMGMPGPYGGGGGYGAYGPYYGGYGFGPSVGFGYGGMPGYGGIGFGGNGYGLGGYGYGAFNYAQQLYQMQSLQTQQVFQAEQTALIAKLDAAQQQVARLDAQKEQLFQQYLNMSDTDKEATRLSLMNDYVRLDPHDREGWKRDTVVQTLIGKELPRLDVFAAYRTMNANDKARFRQQLVEKYRSLPENEQAAWRSDTIVESILGKEWWLR